MGLHGNDRENLLVNRRNCMGVAVNILICWHICFICCDHENARGSTPHLAASLACTLDLLSNPFRWPDLRHAAKLDSLYCDLSGISERVFDNKPRSKAQVSLYSLA